MYSFLSPTLELGIAQSFDFILTSYESNSEKPEKGIFDQAIQLAKCSDPKLAFHVGTSIEHDVLGAVTSGWNPLHVNEWFDEQFPDWSSIDTVDTAKASATRQQEFYQWGRRDESSGLEWVEIWGLDDILTLFGFPEDDAKPVKTTYIRNVKGDF